jgi:DNA ligase-1
MGRHPRPGRWPTGGARGSIRAPATTSRGLPRPSRGDRLRRRDRRRTAGRATRQATGTFSDLQQRLNRKSVSAKLMAKYPAFMRCLRPAAGRRRGSARLPFDAKRRARLEADFVAKLDPRVSTCRRLSRSTLGRARRPARNRPPHPVIEGVMLKRRDSALSRGAPERAVVQVEARSRTVDCRADVCAARPRQALVSFYSDYTFGVWTGRGGRNWCRSARPISASPTRNSPRSTASCATTRSNASGRCARSSTRARPGLVLEIAFEGAEPLDPAQIRRRHALSAHLAPLRWDKPPGEADRIEALAGAAPALRLSPAPSTRVARG